MLINNVHVGSGSSVNGSTDDVVEFERGKFVINTVAVANGSMSNSWVNHTTELPVSYWIDSDGLVHVEGQVTTGTIGQIVFTLPLGFRPTDEVRFASASNGAFGETYITPAGSVYALVGSNARFSFSGVAFRAA